MNEFKDRDTRLEDSNNIDNEKADTYHLQSTYKNEPSQTKKLINPLHGLSKAEVLANVEEFCRDKGLEDKTDVFKRGALIAQRPTEYEEIQELTEEDLHWLRKSTASKWSQPKMLYFTVIVCAIGAATQGWDQTGSNGANLSFPTEFGIATPVDQPGGAADEWKVGFVNAAPYISSALLGAWLSDPLNHFLGRRGEVFVTSLILIITPIASGFTHSWQALAVVRLILGIGMGAKAATVPMYAAELSPANIRGALVMGWQLWTAFGIFLGFAANAVVKDVGAIAWRLQLGSAFIPALPLALLIFFCPESPRWLMKKGRYPKAFAAMCRLRYTETLAARDMYYAYVQLMEENKIVQGKTYISRFTELFTIPRVRRGTLAASTVMLAQQMCGINIIAFYSSTIFVESGYTNSQALFASLGFGAVNFVFAFPAIFTIDTFGRRSLLLATFPNMAWTLLAAGMMFFIPDTESNTTMRTGLIAFFIYLFAAFYSVGEGPVPFMYSAEVFPLPQREQGMAWSVSVCLGFSSILSLTFPRMLRALTPPGAFGAYAAFNVIALVLIFFFVPETKQLTLEELDTVFSVPTATFTKYQTGTVLPHWFRRWFLFRKGEKLAPLVIADDYQTTA
ncbi:uncharacterized protein IL334_005758 [Kwoniella shivajii]|uniref:Major facilitator superfamily (MFS) profile domain-containing protein n=1 Tax=Kwoniella shivajii TaxID=564305 RepID=A0ABZ1D4C5_9TREE|nr:hypothetical protein IL334_005758 [Kwoniella shivajii]